MAKKNLVELKGFELKNPHKLDVARNGDGNNFAGFGDDDDAVLAEYDKRGGAIFKDGQKLKTGCFYDFKKKQPRAKPLVEVEGEIAKKKGGTTVETVGGTKKPVKGAKKIEDEEEVDEEEGSEDEE